MSKPVSGGLSQQYRKALFDEVIPFWIRHSMDRECGGYFTCLGRDGSVYDRDKFVWLQARQVWMFASLYNRCEKRREWLGIAEHGAAFLTEHGRDDNGHWYFSLTRKGEPLVQPYNIFSDCFAAMGFGQYALAKGDDHARHLAKTTFDRILVRKAEPKGRYNKAVPGTRPMILLVEEPMPALSILFSMSGVKVPSALKRSTYALSPLTAPKTVQPAPRPKKNAVKPLPEPAALWNSSRK